MSQENEAGRAEEFGDAAEITARERIVRAIAFGLLLVAATIVAYQQVWRAGYIWQDDRSITDNGLLSAPDGLKQIWFSLPSARQFAPLVFSLFRLEHAFWGVHAAGYHWVSLFLHVANALLLWRLLRVLDVPGSWLAALLFALHPVQVESVAWISARANLLMGFFFLLALLAWVTFVAGERRGQLKFYFAALLCGALALTSSPGAAWTLALVLLLISWLKRGAVSLARVVQVIPFALLSLASVAIIWWQRFHTTAPPDLVNPGIADRALIAARNFWFYLAQLVWPAHLSFQYPRSNISTAHPADYVWLAACLVLVVAIWIARRWTGRGPETAFMFFAIMLAPALGFVVLATFRYSFAADRYLYLASIGPLALAAAGISTALDPLPRMKPALLGVIGAVLLAVLGFRTWQHAGIFANNERLWSATAAANPSSSLAQNQLGLELLNSGRQSEALPHFEEALRLSPDDAEAHYNLANALVALGRADEAQEHYERALVLDPQNPRVRASIGQELVRQGKGEEAIEQLKAVVDAAPSSVEAQNELVLTLLTQGKIQEAREQAERTARAHPGNATAQTNFGIILAELGQADEAIAQFQKALAADPANADAHYNLGNSFLRRHQIADAMIEYRKAIESRPDFAGARMNFANTLVESGRLDEAVAEYRKVIEGLPNYAAAHANLASALNHLGRFDEALDELRTAWRLEAEARSGSPAPQP